MFVIDFAPITSFLLASLLDLEPGIVPPPAIGGRGRRKKLLRRQRRHQMVALLPRLARDLFGLGGPEKPEFAADRNRLVEDVFLLVGMLGEDEERLLVE